MVLFWTGALWAIELKFLMHVSYNTLNCTGFKFRLPCPAQLESPTIKRDTSASSVVSCHCPRTPELQPSPEANLAALETEDGTAMARVPCALQGSVPCRFPQQLFLPLLCHRLASSNSTLGLLKLLSSLPPPKHRRDLGISWIVCGTAQWLHIAHTPNTHRTLCRLLSHYTSLSRSKAIMACSFPWLWRALSGPPRARNRIFKL